MKGVRRSAAILCLLAGLAPNAAAQVGISNLLSARSGYDPFDFQPVTDRVDFYDQLDFTYGFSQGRIGARFETYHTSEDDASYDLFTQRWAEWNDAGGALRVRAGNFYTILGRGLVHRSFELPGVVLEPVPQPRRQYGPSRDVDGGLIEGALGPFSLRALAGSPRPGDLVPEEGEPLHVGELFGGELRVRPLPYAEAGAVLARLSNDTPSGVFQQRFGSGYAGADPLRAAGVDEVSAPIYVEYAQEGRDFGEWWEFDTADSVPHALYASANVLAGPFGISAEWKDYWGFRTGINDPPSLIREHTARILNRNTHVLDAADEEGYQLEATYAIAGWGSLTANRSRADGSFFTRPSRYEEFYAEALLQTRRWPRLEATIFYDDGRDDQSGIDDWNAAGAAASYRVRDPWSVSGDVEWQRAVRLGDPYEDLYVSVGAARAGRASASLVWERTTDPLLADREDPQPTNHFVSGLMSVTLTEQHEAYVFAGERRGGRACTAGTCYEVLPFRGVEIRLLTRF